MLFNSYTFCLLFLPLCLAGFVVALRVGNRAVCAWLLLASFGFYAWWNPAHVPLLLASIVGNYALGCGIVRFPKVGGWTTGLGVALNLGLLGYFKYAGFLTATAASATGLRLDFQTIALPLAISFYTFQQIAFLVDVRRDAANLSGPLHYALFVAFFPQLIAGPIVAHRDIVPQFKAGWGGRYPWDRAAAGLTLFAIGLCKKVFIADLLAKSADAVFMKAAAGGAVGCLDAWGGTLAYGLQLYFDFSGYSDMAIGLGGLFGIALPQNFNSPYKSLSVDDFWRRWHMTLGAFFREYLYFPLGGSRQGESRTAFNLFLTMLLCGLWHGAGWAFVIWGGAHGLALVACRLWKRHARPLPSGVAWGLTFLFVTLAWVPFRAEALSSTLLIYKAMLGYGGAAEAIVKLKHLPQILGMLVVALALPNAYQWVHGDLPRFGWKPTPVYAYLTAAALFAVVLNLNRMSTFLYFNF